MLDGSKLRAGACCAGAVMVVAGIAPIARADQNDPARFVERPGHTEFSGRVIARPRPGLAAGRSIGARARLAPMVLDRCAATDEYLLVAPVPAAGVGAGPMERGRAENELAATLMATGDYEYVTPDWRCYPEASSTNDPFLALQWHHARLNSQSAWDISHGSPGVTVAFVDTGVDVAHADLAASRVSGYNSVTKLAESAGGQVSDIVGHGTHVAGCAVAIGNNGVGGAGVGWSLKFMMVRTSNDSWGAANVWDILDGARWANDHGARVVSVSYAGIEDPTVQTTGAYIRSHGGLLLFAADNTSTDHSDFDWPDVLVVGAVNQSDQLAWFSSFGAAVDVVAPGTAIYSTKRGGGYEYREGTSFATPLVAGLAGVIWSINPSLSSSQVESLIEDSCTDLGAPGEDGVFGRGIVNAFESVKRAAGTLGPAAPVAVGDSASATGGVSKRIDVLANDYDVNGDPIKISLLSEWSDRGATLSRSIGTGPGGRDEILYRPLSGLSGADHFKYRVSDTTGRSGVGDVNVQVAAHCLSDVDFSGFVNAADFELFLGWFDAADLRADLDRNGFINAVDFDLFLDAFVAGC